MRYKSYRWATKLQNNKRIKLTDKSIALFIKGVSSGLILCYRRLLCNVPITYIKVQRNFFYTIKFTCFSPSFLSLLSRQMIYYVIWNILQCRSLTQEKSCKQDSPSAAGSFSDIIPIHRSALLPERLYFLCTFMYVIGTLQSNLL